ncbi:SDR family NAD(P)-dependent oxidoreductase [Lentzea sp. NBRC 102530]|uniref:SDR family NAD(P)-dependent oxidoreductase n=1 Tax=Lentzea sp. NBRC 102530 TaxID=3032201 RepID=UPI0024A285F8|nr:SDR family NAD(P)-dependent oxidoreductase [Lentzea sp. NBRC 102530]GLY50128.1 hypothetical protein Lesp01_37840 [Lentzea sp. NBRC 102530]
MGRRAVVTAGTGGIGLETASGLADAGFAVTVVGRNGERGAQAVERINARGGEEARFLQADLSSLDEVRALAAVIAGEGELDVLVNNVGAMFADRVDLDGVEGSFVVNHLSPYLLTELLLPVLTDRVVNVTSGAVVAARKVFEAVEPPGGYYGFHWYGRAKLANLAYTLELARRLEGTGVKVGLRVLWPLVRRTFEKSTSGPADVAARSSIVAATGDLPSGTVIGRHAAPVKPAKTAADLKVQRAVRRLSERYAPLGRVPDGVSN